MQTRTHYFNILEDINLVASSLQNGFWSQVTQETPHIIRIVQVLICRGNWLYLVWAL